MTRRFGLIFIIGVCLCIACAAARSNASTVVWVNNRDGSLWKTSLDSSSDTSRIYDNNVGDLLLALSPDGRYVATNIGPKNVIGIFDCQKAGSRRTIKLRNDDFREKFLGEWGQDGKGILVLRYSNSVEEDAPEVADQLLEMYPDGSTKIILPDISYADYAKYSQDKQILALSDGKDLTIILPQTKKTQTVNVDDQAIPFVWVDDNHIVTAGYDRLRYVDVTKNKVVPFMSYDSIQAMAYSKSRRRLYAAIKDRENDDFRLYSFDLQALRGQQVKLAGLTDILDIFGISSDGKTAVVLACDPSYKDSDSVAPGICGLWSVDLDTGQHRLISTFCISAVVLP